MSDAKKPKRKRKFFSLTCITMLAFENNFIKQEWISKSISRAANSSVCFKEKKKNKPKHIPCSLSNDPFSANVYDLTDQ